jgi:hypothetical protein
LFALVNTSIKLHMKWKEAASRIKGISTPLGGVDFDLPEAEAVVARRVIALLEDRRVLYGPFTFESPEACVQSANQIRNALTDELGQLPSDSQLRTILQRIRQASRDFVTTVEQRIGHGARRMSPDGWSAAEFGLALGTLRSTVGRYVAILASTYQVDVDDDLGRYSPSKTRRPRRLAAWRQ